ncbi:MAG: hypothetical protein ACXIT9_12455 [Nitritalea sp.]
MVRHYFLFTILSFINPLITICVLFFIRKMVLIKWGLIALFTVWGGIMPITEGMDGMTLYNWMIYEYENMSFSYFVKGIYYILTFQNVSGLKGDLYIHFLSYSLFPLLGVPNLFFFAVAFFYSYFFVSALFKILVLTNDMSWRFSNFIFFVSFILFCSLENMQSVRTWTGMWFLVNAVLGFYINKDNKYLFLIMFTPFFHTMYFIFILPVLLFFRFSNVPRLPLFVFFIFSFIISVPQVNVLTLRAQNTELGASKVDSYTGDDLEEKKEEYNSSTNLHKLLGKREATRYYSFYFIFIIFIYSFIKTKFNLSPLFVISVIMISIANYFETAIPVFSGRLSYVASSILLAFLFLSSFNISIFSNFVNTLVLPPWIVLIGFIIFLPRVQFAFLMLLYSTNELFFISPISVTLFQDNYQSMREILEFLF